MYWLYSFPYALLTGFFGVFGSVMAIGVLLLGILRALYLGVLLITGDIERFKAEQVEGLSTVIEKIKSAYAKVTKFFS